MLNQDELVHLRDQVITAATPLLEEQTFSPEKRFSMIMTIFQAQPSIELARKAFSVANEIQDPAMKADALMDIVDEIDLLIDIDIEQSSTEADNQLR